MVLPLAAAFTDRSLGFKQQCGLTHINVQYSDTISKKLVDHEDVGWEDEELLTARSERTELKKKGESVFEMRCYLVCIR